MSGTLFVVATPIGNLADITVRAVKILQDADVIAAEDTRATRRLVTHHGISTPLISYHEHNEQVRTPELLARLEAGESVALVSEAGTPSISDPGYRLVRAAIGADVDVVPIPGASAVLAALVVSGLPTDAFVFEGFLPRKAGERRRRLGALAEESRTLVFFEAPHRLDTCLSDLAAVFGDREVALCRELTKMHEEVRRGLLSDIADDVRRVPVKGEIVLVVAGAADREPDMPAAIAEVRARIEAGATMRDATDAVASERGIARRALYDAVLTDREGPDA